MGEWGRYVNPPWWSGSFLMPQPNTKDESAWKWAMMTIAWTSSDTDHASLRNPLKETQEYILPDTFTNVIHFSLSTDITKKNEMSGVHRTSMCVLLNSHGRCARILLTSCSFRSLVGM